MSYIRRSEYWDYVLRQKDVYKLLQYNCMPYGGAELFKKYVGVINIETSAFCNRKCSYCPLCYIERRQDYITDEVWVKILNELEEIEYEGSIVLNIYNEPLLDIYLINKIKDLKMRMPKCFVQFNSNGDYLSSDIIDELAEAGLNRIIITRHIETSMLYDTIERNEALIEYLKILNLYDWAKKEKSIYKNGVFYIVNYPKSENFELWVTANDWNSYGMDRGGQIAKLSMSISRQIPCSSPMRELTISFEGKVKPCCNIYFGENTDCGDVRENSLLEIYFGKIMTEYRRKLFVFGEKPKKCQGCNNQMNYDKKTDEIREEILKKADLCEVQDYDQY